MIPFSPQTLDIASRIAPVLSAHCAEAYLVGGAVRDSLLCRSTSDLDIAIDSSPHQIGPVLADALDGHLVSLDVERDMVRIVVDSVGAKIDIDIAKITGRGIEEDLRRRDFTVDALAVEFHSAIGGDWQLIDPLGGAADIASRTVRAVSDSALSDDPVRVLRAVRISAKTGFDIHPQTESVVRRDAPLMALSSAERLREELLGILAIPGAGTSVGVMDRLGILSALMPELDESRGVAQPKEHYYDVFGHLTAAVVFADQIVTGRYCTQFVSGTMPRFADMEGYFQTHLSDGHTRGTFLKLTALLHDIAKPATRTVEPSGRIRFFGHSEVGEETAGKILRRLRFSRRGERHVRKMVRHHLRPRLMADKGNLPSSRAIRRYYRDLGDVSLDTLYLNMADFLAARGPLLTPQEMDVQVRVIGHILNADTTEPPAERAGARLLTGHDIMVEFNLESGPLVGRLLKVVAAAEARGLVTTRTEALALAKTDLESGEYIG